MVGQYDGGDLVLDCETRILHVLYALQDDGQTGPVAIGVENFPGVLNKVRIAVDGLG